MHAGPRIRSGVIAVTCSVFACVTLLMVDARSQGVSAPKSTIPKPVDEMADLQRQIKEMLQKEERDAQAAQRSEATIKGLEQRLAALENAQRNQSAQKTPSEPSHTFNLPFTIVDDNDKPVLTVTRGPTGSARMSLGDPKGAQLNMVVSAAGEPSIQWVDRSASARISVAVNGAGSTIFTAGKEGWTFIGIDSEGIPLVQILNPEKIPVAELRGMLSHDGQVNVYDAQGVKMVGAGVATKGVGVIKTGPNGNGPAATLGNAGMAASEIQGRK